MQVAAMIHAINLVSRLCVGAVAGLVYYWLLNLLSLLPLVLDGQFGIKDEWIRSTFVRFVFSVVPLGWFACISSPLFGWTVFRSLPRRALRAEVGFLCGFGVFLICGLRIVCELTYLNLTTAVMPEDPSRFTKGVNLFVLVCMAVWAGAQEVSYFFERTKVKVSA